jgi:hypothetical protein
MASTKKPSIVLAMCKVPEAKRWHFGSQSQHPPLEKFSAIGGLLKRRENRLGAQGTEGYLSLKNQPYGLLE